MAQIVILISALMLSELGERQAGDLPVSELAQLMEKCGAKVNMASATPNPDKADTYFLTITVEKKAEDCAAALRGYEGVLAAYVKPREALP